MTKEEFIEYCKERGYDINDDQFSGRDKIEGNLRLEYLTEIPEGFNPKVGGDLYLDSLTSIPEGFNPVLKYDLYLDSLSEIPENWNPTNIGKGIYINNYSINIKPELKFINFEI